MHTHNTYSLKSVIAADPSLTDAQYALGLVYRKLEKSTHAEKHFMKALELEPHHNEALVELGYMHYTQKNFTQVIGLLKKLPKTELFSSMEFVQAGSLLVNSHIQLGHWREAEELFEMMLSRGSQKLQIDALNGLGKLELKYHLRVQYSTNQDFSASCPKGIHSILAMDV